MTEHNAIPAMTDPLGRYWEQPADIRLAPMDDTHVLLEAHQVQQLLHYDATIPTGVYPGKCWGRREREPDRHLLAWYGEETTGANGPGCPILFREILTLGADL